MSPRLFRARPARVVPAVIVAIIILALAVGLGWAAIAAIAAEGSGDSALSSGFSGFTDLGAAQWGATAIIAMGAVLMLLGLIFMIAGISPGARRLIRSISLIPANGATTPPHPARVGVFRPPAAVPKRAAAPPDSVDGVSSVRAASNASSTNITFSTPVRDNDQIRTDVDAAVSQRFSQIAFDRTPTVKVRAQRRQA